jgi:hypothetical protein
MRATNSSGEKGAGVGLSGVLHGVTLGADVLPAHVEDHGGTSTVLDSCIAAELDQV